MCCKDAGADYWVAFIVFWRILAVCLVANLSSGWEEAWSVNFCLPMVRYFSDFENGGVWVDVSGLV